MSDIQRLGRPLATTRGRAVARSPNVAPVVGVVLVLGGGVLIGACGGDDAASSFRSADAETVDPTEIDVDYLIPAGTGAEIDAVRTSTSWRARSTPPSAR